MKLLLDTQTLLWFLTNDPQLSSAAKTSKLGRESHYSRNKWPGLTMAR